jgi:hypothetical protein
MTKTTDEEQIDTLIAAFYSTFDNRNGARPTLTDVTDCFADKAVIARRSNVGTDLYTPEEFALPRIALLTGGALLDFHEWEVDATTQVFDGIAVRTSRYSKSGLFNGEDYGGHGTKCFQLVEMSSGWRIASFAWVDDVA